MDSRLRGNDRACADEMRTPHPEEARSAVTEDRLNDQYTN